jgi:DNA-binding LytR/AlgR family response regulator
MNCVVIDDEPLARKGMELLIEQVEWLNLTAAFSNVVDAAGFLKNNNVDVVFLDIQMPRMNGLEFLKSTNFSSNIVITTAYPQFAVDAFELDVVDYLVKPIRFERFFKAINKIKENALKPTKDILTEENYIFIRSERKYIRVNYNEIDFIEGLKDYVIVHCGNEKHIVATNLKAVLGQLPQTIFVRINKSNLINISKIKSFDNDFVYINNGQLSIGDAFKKEFLNFLATKKTLKRQ